LGRKKQKKKQLTTENTEVSKMGKAAEEAYYRGGRQDRREDTGEKKQQKKKHSAQRAPRTQRKAGREETEQAGYGLQATGFRYSRDRTLKLHCVALECGTWPQGLLCGLGDLCG